MANSAEPTFKRRIPTNLITGFLGVGKTTAVLDILRRKPAQEKWAVLVNEFGEIGIDVALLAGGGADAPDIEIRQIAGGCMCCVAELPMKVALNALINRTKPDRLLIETTGLGHPQALVDTLTDASYASLLDLRAIICLLDPRKLREARYLQHPIFRDQLRIADVIVANKTDLCDADDAARYSDFFDAMQPRKQIVGWVAQGQLQPSWLDLPHRRRSGGMPVSAPIDSALADSAPADGSAAPSDPAQSPPSSIALRPGELFARREHRGDGYFSCGWLFDEQVRFDRAALAALLTSLRVARLKGALRTELGIFLFNQNGDSDKPGSQRNLDNGDGDNDAAIVAGVASRLEIIHSQPLDWQRIEQQLLAAMAPNPS